MKDLSKYKRISDVIKNYGTDLRYLDLDYSELSLRCENLNGILLPLDEKFF